MAHPPAEPLVLLPEQRLALEEMASSASLPHRMVREAKGLLLTADGVAKTEIGRRLGVSRSTVLGWRQQYPRRRDQRRRRGSPGAGP